MSHYLEKAEGPLQVKKLSLAQMQELAEEIRQEMISVLAKNGGHLGPNLGVVELTIALHAVFNTPKDKFIWDVSHQIYVHKLLTGRRDRFNTIRSTNGLSGFAVRSESEHDCYGAAHAGTALSAALGICAARDQLGTDENVVAIFGDAALTNGISFEAMNKLQTEALERILADPAVANVGSSVGASSFNASVNQGRMFIALKPLDQRDGMTTARVVERLRRSLGRIGGISVYLSPARDIRTGARQSNSDYQFTLWSTDIGELYSWLPKVVDRVYSMDTWMNVSDDGGKTFRRVGEKHKHVDNHALWIDPADSDHLLAGCDGGIYES